MRMRPSKFFVQIQGSLCTAAEELKKTGIKRGKTGLRRGCYELLQENGSHPWPFVHKGNQRAVTIPIGSKQGHYVTLCAA